MLVLVILLVLGLGLRHSRPHLWWYGTMNAVGMFISKRSESNPLRHTSSKRDEAPVSSCPQQGVAPLRALLSKNVPRSETHSLSGPWSVVLESPGPSARLPHPSVFISVICGQKIFCRNPPEASGNRWNIAVPSEANRA